MPISHPLIELTEFQQNALIGSMLGDGSLFMQKRNISPILQISRTTKDKDYLEYEHSIFENFKRPRYQNGPQPWKTWDKRYKKFYEGFEFATVATQSLLPYYNLWYPNHIKIVPNNLKLNGQIVAHWLCDDGHITTNKLDHRFQFDIATEGFSKEEVQFLMDLLSDRYNEKFRIKNSIKDEQLVIRAYDSACRTIIKDIDIHFMMNRKRIWDNPKARYYHNQPERQREMLVDFARRQEIALNFIEKAQDGSLKDLSMIMGYKHGKNIMSVLQTYIDQKVIYITGNNILDKMIKFN